MRQDEGAAAVWFRKAAEQGVFEACGNLGCLYAAGRGVPQSYPEALKWYSVAAEAGSAQSQYNLGVMYAKGFGVKTDYIEAYKWFSLAASQRYTQAVNVLYLFSQAMPPAQIEEARRRAAQNNPQGT